MKRTLAAMLNSIAITALLLPALVLAFSTGPIPGHTGGFNENSCQVCHLEFPVNSGRTMGGQFYVAGVPKSYQPGTTYPITVVIAHPGQSRWGFQLSARFQQSGTQAGRLIPGDENTLIQEMDGIQYISHTQIGTREGFQDGPVQFTFNWAAPTDAGGPVFFNAAGNAANSSADPLGDYIYTAGAYSLSAAGPGEVIQPVAEQGERRSRRIHSSSRFMHIPAPVDLNRGDMEVHIEHRFIQSLKDASPGNAFGIDAGANINLGFQYALGDRLTAGISRARFDQIVALNGTYEFVTEEQSPWKLSLLAGVQGRRNFHRQYSPYLQLASSVDYRFLRAYVVPSMIFNTRDEQELEFFPDPNNPDHNNTFSLGLGIDAAINRNLSTSLEVVPRLSGFGGFGESTPAMSGGIKIRSWGHVFTIMASTSRAFTPGQYGVNTEPDFSLGFNIYRRIR